MHHYVWAYPDGPTFPLLNPSYPCPLLQIRYSWVCFSFWQYLKKHS